MVYKKLFSFLFVLVFIGNSYAVTDSKQETGDHPNPESEIEIAAYLLDHVVKLYQVPEYNLLSETYPVNPNHRVDYLAEGTAQKKQQEVSFLWPFSGVLSGAVSLYSITKDQKFLDVLEHRTLPGLEQYYDTSRLPVAYQSYPVFAGHSDRFYDDNVWLALDFCELYAATKNQKYLDKAVEIYKFVYSGWDNKLGGGIFWSEQHKRSKNTCSNAPGAVLSAKLYQLTNDSEYLKKATETYNWTKANLLDPQDFVYWDNISLNGNIDKRKYSYNSGQMIEAGVLLYQITADERYLTDAQKTAAGSYNYFTKLIETETGEKRFYPDSPWFNTILLRGLKALYAIDSNNTYIAVMRENIHYAWNNLRDSNGLLASSWHAQSDNPYKWLLDNACLIELFAELSEIK